MADNIIIYNLILKSITDPGSLTQQERDQLDEWKKSPANLELFKQLHNPHLLQNELILYHKYEASRIASKDAAMKKLFSKPGQVTTMIPKPRKLVLATAAILACITLLIQLFSPGLWYTGEDIQPPLDSKATLTLSNDSTIILNKTDSRILAESGNVRIEKKRDQLVYDSIITIEGDTGSYHLLTTAPGGTYKLVLRDGSRVLLNAATSIRYPVNFSSSNRRVHLQGEAFFEVKTLIEDSNAVPFTVSFESTDGRNSEVVVLGTSFNIKAYRDEPAYTATVFEGKVNIQSGGAEQILMPGERIRIVGDSGMSLLQNVDTTAMWKDNYFHFRSDSIQTVMRELARWYNFEVIYEGNIPFEGITGTLPRDSGLKHVLEVLFQAGIKFRRQGNQLFISP